MFRPTILEKSPRKPELYQLAGSSLNFEHRKIYTLLEPFLPVRYFTWKDLPDLLEFASLVQSSGAPQDREIARRNFREVLEQPWLEPEKNCLLLEVEGQIRGYCLIIAELTHPFHRRRAR